ncbi:hypothetical protein F2P81_010070 [Scophthalmus maximus]|uniref:Uncharacterized protein n=1 Tax=Scophthalmus maximus TaxID=52904 RepID=A0A6A4SPW9_SCOMX|nr:hypothetical protein F2P81_010070 [Scophthalmus maximus]
MATPPVQSALTERRTRYSRRLNDTSHAPGLLRLDRPGPKSDVRNGAAQPGVCAVRHASVPNSGVCRRVTSSLSSRVFHIVVHDCCH